MESRAMILKSIREHNDSHNNFSKKCPKVSDTQDSKQKKLTLPELLDSLFLNLDGISQTSFEVKLKDTSESKMSSSSKGYV